MSDKSKEANAFIAGCKRALREGETDNYLIAPYLRWFDEWDKEMAQRDKIWMGDVLKSERTGKKYIVTSMYEHNETTVFLTEMKDNPPKS